MNTYTYENKDGAYTVMKNGELIISGLGEVTDEEMIDIRNEYDFKDIYGGLGMCGCGSPNEVKLFFRDFLSNLQKDNSLKLNRDLISATSHDLLFEIIGHMLDNAGLTEHGSSVYSSWLTENGKEFLRLLPLQK